MEWLSTERARRDARARIHPALVSAADLSQQILELLLGLALLLDDGSRCLVHRLADNEVRLALEP
jgi:hypothetical protein